MDDSPPVSVWSPMKGKNQNCEASEIVQNGIQTEDLTRGICSNGDTTIHSDDNSFIEVSDGSHTDEEEESSQITDASALKFSSGHHSIKFTGDTQSLDVADTNLSLSITDSIEGLNSSVHDTMPARVKEHGESSTHTSKIFIGLGLDINEADNSNMADHNPFYPYKKLGCNVKSRDASECASTTGPLEECREPMKMWEEIKRNGFLSTPHGGVPTPKQWETLRRNKNGAPNKKAKNGTREQTKKLMNIAAPSGLLAGLNPGIIYHVRNTKQVRSIIDNVVTSERLDDQIENKNIGHEESNNKGGLKRLRDLRHYDEQTSDVLLHEADPLALKLSSAVNTVSEDTNCGSKEEFSANHDNISSLSVKAATIACRWLSLIHQDIRGRLAALRRSRKRVRNTIQRDLPVIFSKGFSSNQENDPHFSQPQSADATSDIARWRAIFCNMDKALLDEGEHLENRLSQVKEMQLHCERGLQYVSPTAFPRSDPLDNSRPTKTEIIEKEFAVCAAAASIYSTSNLVMTNENMSCL